MVVLLLFIFSTMSETKSERSDIDKQFEEERKLNRAAVGMCHTYLNRDLNRDVRRIVVEYVDSDPYVEMRKYIMSNVPVFVHESILMLGYKEIIRVVWCTYTCWIICRSIDINNIRTVYAVYCHNIGDGVHVVFHLMDDTESNVPVEYQCMPNIVIMDRDYSCIGIPSKKMDHK